MARLDDAPRQRWRGRPTEERVLTVAGERSSMQDDVLAVIGAQPGADIMADCMQVIDTALERTADEQARARLRVRASHRTTSRSSTRADPLPHCQIRSRLQVFVRTEN